MLFFYFSAPYPPPCAIDRCSCSVPQSSSRMCVAVVSLVPASLALARGDQAQAPSSHWATVYTGDTTHYSQPVRDQVYPLPEGVSRTDWFNSYPYHKFEAKQGEEAAAEAGLIENVASAVEDVRQRLSDLGDGVVNSALGLVGAGKKEDTYQEREGTSK